MEFKPILNLYKILENIVDIKMMAATDFYCRFGSIPKLLTFVISQVETFNISFILSPPQGKVSSILYF